MNGLPGWLQQGARGLWLVGVLLTTNPTWAQVAGPEPWTRRTMPPGLAIPPEVLRRIAVDVNIGVLRSSERLSMLMPDDRQLPASRSRLVNTPKGFVWSGTIDRQPAGSASFSVVNETAAGSVLTGKGQSFRLRRDLSGVYLLEEIDLRKVPPEGRSSSASGLREDKSNDPALDTCATDSGKDIDLMVVYTAAARAYAGADALEADIFLAVEQANESYLRSGIDQQLRLAHIAEVSYTESGSSLTDRTMLQNGSISAVHSLRDSHGADLVALITETLDDCGRSFTMDPVGNAFESKAFAVVQRNCMSLAGKHSLAHELGHPMSARHDWKVDSTDNSPFAYNHGHVEMAPAFGLPWRTLMAYDDRCRDAFVTCPRVLNWSNPSVDVGGSPTGVASGAEQADNRRTLNNTATTVANFRCSSPGRDDAWMKDTWSDTGMEPDPAQAGQPMWESPYIWVRNSQDLQRVHQHQHQNPVVGQTNYIYVKLHHGAAVSGNLEIKVANATLGLGWPGNWTTVSAVPITVAAAGGSTRIVEVAWTPPAAGHFCLVARWDSASDPMTKPEGGNIEVNVRDNNNIVWRNVNLIELGGPQPMANAGFEVPGVGPGRTFVLSIRPVPTRRPAGVRVPGFMAIGRISLTLDKQLMESWRGTGFQGEGLRRSGNVITVVDPAGAQLTLRALQAPGQAQITFSRRKAAGHFSRDEFGWRVTQSAAVAGPPQALGGITYQIRTFAP